MALYPRMGPSSSETDTSRHGVLRMHRVGPPTCCPVPCGHLDFARRRREALVECVVCQKVIAAGEFYRILSRVNHEVASVVHELCERRMATR